VLKILRLPTSNFSKIEVSSTNFAFLKKINKKEFTGIFAPASPSLPVTTPLLWFLTAVCGR